MATPQYDDSIYRVDIDKVVPNPYQPRREFDPNALQALADSIRQYGVMQPLTVTRHEQVTTDGGLDVQYELVAGERRLRASRMAGLKQVPVIIRTGEESNRMKLELAIIENLQREDLNAIDRANAFAQLHKEFSMTHAQIGKKMGRSREYVSNTIRLLQLSPEMQQALVSKKIAEGHTRPLLMLKNHPEQQQALFREIMHRHLSVRESEKIARSIAKERVRKPAVSDPKILNLEEKLSENLGTRVHIEKNKKKGGKIVIDYFNEDELRSLLDVLQDARREGGVTVPVDGNPQARTSAGLQEGDVSSFDEYVSVPVNKPAPLRAVFPEDEDPSAQPAATQHAGPDPTIGFSLENWLADAKESNSPDATKSPTEPAATPEVDPEPSSGGGLGDFLNAINGSADIPSGTLDGSSAPADDGAEGNESDVEDFLAHQDDIDEEKTDTDGSDGLSGFGDVIAALQADTASSRKPTAPTLDTEAAPNPEIDIKPADVASPDMSKPDLPPMADMGKVNKMDKVDPFTKQSQSEVPSLEKLLTKQPESAVEAATPEAAPLSITPATLHGEVGDDGVPIPLG